MLTRRRLLKRGAAVGAGVMLPLGYRVAPGGAAPGLPLSVDELPDLLGNVVTPVDGASSSSYPSSWPRRIATCRRVRSNHRSLR